MLTHIPETFQPTPSRVFVGVMALALALGCSDSHTSPDGGDGGGVDSGFTRIDSGGPPPTGDGGPPPTGATCAAVDAEGEGACRQLLGFGWNGRGCISIGGCECVGRDCDTLFDDLTECEAAHSGCAACEAMDVTEVGGCEPVRGYYWDGSACVLLSGCSCEGVDCDRVYPSPAVCEAAYRACVTDPSDGCRTDADCERGEEWCVEGECVDCDNGGLVCLLACPEGWSLYERNGCFPCECAPDNGCTRDTDCPFGALEQSCLAGEFCADWCPEDDPSCCFGNVCASTTCAMEDPLPLGCAQRGCPRGERCDREVTEPCRSSSCECAGEGWACDDDCGGGVCVPE